MLEALADVVFEETPQESQLKLVGHQAAYYGKALRERVGMPVNEPDDAPAETPADIKLNEEITALLTRYTESGTSVNIPTLIDHLCSLVSSVIIELATPQERMRLAAVAINVLGGQLIEEINEEATATRQ